MSVCYYQVACGGSIMLYFLLLLFVFLPFPKLQRRGFHEDYLEKNSVLPIKGLFVLFVFFRHSREYFVYDGPLDSVFLYIDSHMIQLIVSMFLFYSGFGIYESIKIKGEDTYPVFLRTDFCVYGQGIRSVFCSIIFLTL